MRHALAIALVLSACGSKKEAPTSEGEGEAAPFVATPRDALVGHRAPPVTLALLDGSSVDLAAVIGKKPIYLKFWATWCVPCREQMPHLDATFRDHGDQLAVYAVDVGINDPIENVRAFIAKKHLTMPVAYDDGSVAEHFDLNVTPQHVLIDRKGVIRYIGHAVTPELDRAIEDVLKPGGTAPAAEPVKIATTLPPLVLDDGSKLDFATRAKKPIALTFATLFCDSYIAESRPEIGAACAAHAKKLEEVHKSHPEIAWITVAFPVWTSADDIGEYRKRLGATTPIGIDRGNLWFRKFGVRDSYTTILFDAAGTELGRAGGDGAGVPALVAKLSSKTAGLAAYDRKDYAECARILDATTDLYDAACCHALAKQADPAFASLAKLEGHDLPSLDHLKSDEDLASLHADPRWAPLVKAIADKIARFHANDNAELTKLYDADQGDRSGPMDKIDWKVVGPRDTAREKRVDELVAAGKAKTAEDYYHAAMVFQHTSTPDGVQRAHDLAAKAVELDPEHATAKWLAAASLDRKLMYENKPQKYGTQFKKVDGHWILWDVDPAISDEERAKWNCPPIADARAKALAMDKQ